MNDTATVPPVTAERLRVLKAYTVGYGLAAPQHIGPRPGLLDDEGRGALGVNSYSELMRVLQFAETIGDGDTPEHSNPLLAAFNALNLQLDMTRDYDERRKAFINDHLLADLGEEESQKWVTILEESGLLLIALGFANLRQRLTDTDDGK